MVGLTCHGAVLKICSSAGAGLEVFVAAEMLEREFGMRGEENSSVVDSGPFGVVTSEASLTEREIGGEDLLTKSGRISLLGGTSGREETLA